MDRVSERERRAGEGGERGRREKERERQESNVAELKGIETGGKEESRTTYWWSH